MTVRTATIARWAVRAALLFVLSLIVAALAVLIVIPRTTHGAAMTVLTGSMSPTIPTGSVVIVRPVDPGTLHVGDVATYQKAPGKAEPPAEQTARCGATLAPPENALAKGQTREPDPAQAREREAWRRIRRLPARS